MVRMQSDARLPVASRLGYKHIGDALVRIAKEEGVRTYWRGATPTGKLMSKVIDVHSYTHFVFGWSWYPHRRSGGAFIADNRLKNLELVDRKSTAVVLRISHFFPGKVAVCPALAPPMLLRPKYSPGTISDRHSSGFACSKLSCRQGGLTLFREASLRICGFRSYFLDNSTCV